MEKLLKMAMKISDEAEIIYYERNEGSLTVRNSDLRDIEGKIQSGYALRIIRNGKIGSAYTRNIIDREELVKNAKISQMGNVDAGFSFPDPARISSIDQYDKKVEDLTYSDLHENGMEVLNFFDGKVKGQVDYYTGFSIERKRIINSHGVDYDSRQTTVGMVPCLLYPNTETAVLRYYISRGMGKIPKKELQEQLDVYKASLPEIDVDTGKVDVLFTPRAIIILMWRIFAGAGGRTIYEKTSPVTGKTGQKVLSESITIYTDPLNTNELGACAFDDEGVPTKRLEIYSNGIFKTPYVNLDYSSKLKVKPTGTGFRQVIHGSDDLITTPPSSYLRHPRIATGDMKYKELVESMDIGVIIHGSIGAHSGNILNGDFSVGLNPGFLVKKGDIVGRVKDGMAAGNTYNLFRSVVGIEDRIHEPESDSKYPCILFDNVNISGK